MEMGVVSWGPVFFRLDRDEIWPSLETGSSKSVLTGELGFALA